MMLFSRVISIPGHLDFARSAIFGECLGPPNCLQSVSQTIHLG
jgi:hypothetical protein